MINRYRLKILKLIPKDFELSIVSIDIKSTLMKSNKVFLNLKIVRVIALMKSTTKLAPNLKRSINEKTICNFSSDNIKNPRDYHTTTMSPDAKKEIIGCWVGNPIIYKTNLVFYNKSHKHGLNPSVVLRACQVVRNQNKTRVISIVEGERTVAIFHKW